MFDRRKLAFIQMAIAGAMAIFFVYGGDSLCQKPLMDFLSPPAHHSGKPLPGQKRNESIKNTIAWELLKTLKFHDPAKIPGIKQFDSVSMDHLRFQRGHCFFKTDQEITVMGGAFLQRHLAMVSTFDFLYNERNHLIAVFPVFTKLQKMRLEDHGEKAYYLDLSPYYAPLLNINDPRGEIEWRTFVENYLNDQKLIRDYLNYHSLDDLINRVDPEQKPFALIEIKKSSGELTITELSLDSGFNPYQYAASLREEEIGFYLLPIYPTVYSPATKRHQNTDQRYHQLLSVKGLIEREFFYGVSLQEGQTAYVVGPGSGYDTLLTARQVKGPVFTSGINPLEIANTKTAARLNGFKIHSRVYADLLSERGIPAFRGIRYDWIMANMPAYHSYDRSKKTLQDYWDGDYEGKTLSRFARGLKTLLKPGGHALVWNFQILLKCRWEDLIRPSMLESIPFLRHLKLLA